MESPTGQTELPQPGGLRPPQAIDEKRLVRGANPAFPFRGETEQPLRPCLRSRITCGSNSRQVSYQRSSNRSCWRTRNGCRFHAFRWHIHTKKPHPSRFYL